MSDANIPCFGEKEPGVEYTPRPAAYGLCRDEAGRLALILEPFGYYLPGGGIDPGESPEQALCREFREELGWDIQIGPFLAEAECWIYSPRYRAHHRNIGRFFRIDAFRTVTAPIEEDHQLIWMPPEEAIECLEHPHQAWAVRAFLT